MVEELKIKVKSIFTYFVMLFRTYSRAPAHMGRIKLSILFNYPQSRAGSMFRHVDSLSV